MLHCKLPLTVDIRTGRLGSCVCFSFSMTVHTVYWCGHAVQQTASESNGQSVVVNGHVCVFEGARVYLIFSSNRPMCMLIVETEA